MLIILRVNETQHIGMSDTHHSHIGAASHASLLHDIGNLIHDVHEGHWPRGNTASRSDKRAVRSQEFISHTRAAAGLMNRGRSLSVLHDSRDRVRNFEHKTRSQLSISASGVYQTRSVGNELTGEHYIGHC